MDAPSLRQVTPSCCTASLQVCIDGLGVYVKFIGTHAEYDKVDAAVVDQFKGV